ncbi:MAG TPA: glycoside hydrolase family 2 TIM barrel-domain containing protein [Opitutaceae bacterium]|nr:glycoside hydrolase family 2 TIM barrel-domain containing protein [Opitutaceae bacterium]
MNPRPIRPIEPAVPATRGMTRRHFVETCALGAMTLAGARVLRGAAGVAPGPGPAHYRLRLDDGWRFGGRFDPAAVAPSFNDSRFEPIALPHCVARLSWQRWDPGTWDGVWIYRRRFRLPPNFAGRRVFLRFDAVMTVATPYLNGRALPAHEGGYLPFRREITDALVDGDNVLAVAVDARWSNVPPEGAADGRRTIDFYEPGGMVRSVWLEAVPPAYVREVFAKPVEVLTPGRRIDVSCEIDAHTVPESAAELAVELRDGDRILARAAQKVHVGKAGETAAALTLPLPAGIVLWDVEHPHRYDLVTRLSVDGLPVHDHVTRIGLRDAQFRRDGFYLNGRRLQLFGLNRHELFPYAGFAMPPRAMRRDAEILRRELNCNAVRCSHYPQSDAFLDACDELGLLVWEEMPAWHYIGDAAWQDRAVRDVEAMIRRDRNRPSVVIWGVRVNESKNNPELYRRTTAAGRALDDSRPMSGAMNGPMHSRRDWDEDVFAYNDYHHPGPAGSPELRAPIPDVPYLITEAVGQIVGPGPAVNHMYRRSADAAVQMRQALYHADVHDQAAANPRYAGVLAWCAFEYGSPMNSHDGVKNPGVCDTFREPKLGASFYRAQVDPARRPVIEPNFYWDFGPRTPRGPGTGVAIFSNCSRVEVFVGGQRHAVLHPDRRRYPHLLAPPAFVDLELDGAAHPELRLDGYLGDRLALSRSFSADPRHDRLELQADDAEIAGDGSDGTRVVCKVIDRFGAVRAFAGGLVRFELSGPGELVGDNLFALGEAGGVGAVWVRSLAGQAGTITLRAVHDSLGAAAVPIAVRAAAAARDGEPAR